MEPLRMRHPFSKADILHYLDSTVKPADDVMSAIVDFKFHLPT
jgi:hypothetical protein